MFLTVCNLILSPHPLGRSILDEARDQPIPGSFLKTLGTRLGVGKVSYYMLPLPHLITLRSQGVTTRTHVKILAKFDFCLFLQ